MAIITFEGLAGDNSIEEIPDGYRGLNWKNFAADDNEVFPNNGIDSAIHSGEAAAVNGDVKKPAGFKSPDRDDDFDLNSGFFSSFNANDLKLKVFGFDDGERVAKKVFLLDPTQEFVTFGPRFNDIDEVKFTLSGGTDPDPNDTFPLTQFFGMDDLFLNF